jgi:hypothetical protein
MIDRGVAYASAIDEILDGDNVTKMDLLSELNYLVGYIKLIINTEANFDRPWYIPYYFRCHGGEGCGDFDMSAFTRRYIDAARIELEFIINNFTASTHKHGDTIITPIGNPKAYLRLAELASAFIGEDIGNTLSAYANVSAISDLQNLSWTLRDFNLHNDTTVFPSLPYAVTATTLELRRIFGELTNINDCGQCERPHHREPCEEHSYEPCLEEGPCHHHHPCHDNDLVELLDYPRTLNYDDETTEVYLSYSRYVRGLRLKAEAYGTSARIKVFVNGKLKADPYIPATDPGYYVSIEEYTDKIVLHHESGGRVKIFSVKADLE